MARATVCYCRLRSFFLFLSVEPLDPCPAESERALLVVSTRKVGLLGVVYHCTGILLTDRAKVESGLSVNRLKLNVIYLRFFKDVDRSQMIFCKQEEDQRPTTEPQSTTRLLSNFTDTPAHPFIS